MWNLSGDDIQRAKAELNGRRAAIQAHFDREMKLLESKIADIEAFERAAETFVSNYLGSDGATTTVAEPASFELAPVAETAAGDTAAEEDNPTNEDTPVAHSGDALTVLGPERLAAAKGSSRWRLRLGAGEVSA